MADDLTTAIRLLEAAMHLRANGERAPGGSETWQHWERRAEAFLRTERRRRVLTSLWCVRCELDTDVMQAMDDDALLAHLREAHPGSDEEGWQR